MPAIVVVETCRGAKSGSLAEAKGLMQSLLVINLSRPPYWRLLSITLSRSVFSLHQLPTGRYSLVTLPALVGEGCALLDLCKAALNC
jgi:hypothetical protein